MRKAKYLGLIIGTSVGLLLAYTAQHWVAFVPPAEGDVGFFQTLPVPLGMIGYALGALFAVEASEK